MFLLMKSVTLKAAGLGSDATLAGRTFARSLAQSGSTQCLDVLRTLARDASDPLERADLLVELVETALDYSDECVAAEASVSAIQILRGNAFAPATSDWLDGRLARAKARLSSTQREGTVEFTRSAALLRRSIAAEPGMLAPRVALADTLGDDAVLQFSLGTFAQARAVSSSAVELIAGFGLSNRPRALEIMAMHAAIEAVITGRVQTAIAEVSILLERAAESGWSSNGQPPRRGGRGIKRRAAAITARRFGGIARWRRWHSGARPSDRTGLMLEAAHSYTGMGRPAESLSILGYARPSEGSCPRTEVPDRQAFAAAAFDRLGESAAALREAPRRSRVIARNASTVARVMRIG